MRPDTDCANCEAAIVEVSDGQWVHVDPYDPERPDVCDLGDDYAALPPHRHGYRFDVGDWWCFDCATVTDYCERRM